MSQVLIPPVNPDTYAKSNLEPQYTTQRLPNKAVLYLDSQDCELELDKADLQMSTVSRLGENPSQLAYGITRISVASSGVYYNIPNVNPRNNTITFFSSSSGLFHTVTVPEGFYTSATALITAIRDALNTATGASGLTFNFTTIPGFPNSFNLNSVGGNYYFVLTSSAVAKGYQLWNLPIDQTPTNSKRVGSIDGWYTRYIDITSDTLVKYTKMRTVSTGISPNLVVRLFIDDPTFPHIISNLNLPGVSYAFLPNEPIYTVHFVLLDQYGDKLYIPPGTAGTAGGFYWDVQVLIEI